MARSLSPQWLRASVMFFGSSFLLHLLWENLQAPFYQGYTSFSQHFWVCLKATATGDMLVMLLIYFSLAAAHHDVLWIGRKTAYAHPITWLLPLFLGIIFAIGMEMWALQTHPWAYETMPTVFGIGMLPVLQMIFIPLLVLFTVREQYHLKA